MYRENEREKKNEAGGHMERGQTDGLCSYRRNRVLGLKSAALSRPRLILPVSPPSVKSESRVFYTHSTQTHWVDGV